MKVKNILVGLIGMLICFTSSSVYSEIPRIISFQGVLKDAQGNPVPDGEYAMIFKLYTQPTGGTEIWTEKRDGSPMVHEVDEVEVIVLQRGFYPKVKVENGFYNVLLGKYSSLANVAFDKPYWLEVIVEGSVLSPRYELASSPYALNPNPLLTCKWVEDGDGNIYRLQGKVGIGTDRPAVAPGFHFPVKLNVQSPMGRVPLYLRQDAPANTTPSMIYFANRTGPLGEIGTFGRNNELAILGISGLVLHGSRAGTPDVYIRGNGNVGIGTTEPRVRLQVEGASIVRDTLAVGHILASPLKGTHQLEVRGGTCGPYALLVEANNRADLTGAMMEFNGINGDGILNIFGSTFRVPPGDRAGYAMIKLHPTVAGHTHYHLEKVVLMADPGDVDNLLDDTFRIITNVRDTVTPNNLLYNFGGVKAFTIDPGRRDGSFLKVGIGVRGATPKRTLHIHTGPMGSDNPVIIENCWANNTNARALLNMCVGPTLIIGGPWRDRIYFYWKDGAGNIYHASLLGTPGIPLLGVDGEPVGFDEDRLIEEGVMEEGVME